MRKIYVSDFTLRKLGQDRETSLLFREKTALAAGIDGFCADAVELDFIKNEKEDAIIYKTISAAVKHSKVCVPVGFSREGVNKAWECIKDSAKPCLQVMLPTSTVQMEYIYHVKEVKMLKKIEELCAEASKLCDDVEFVALDATRADREFLKNACRTAEKNGAKAVTLCDDEGTYLPSEFAALVPEIKEICNLPVYVQVSDNIGMAVATAVSAVSAGADGVKTAISGKNVLLTDKFADAIAARGESIDVCTGLKSTEIHSDIKQLIKTVGRTQYENSSASSDEGEAIFLSADSTLPQVCEAVKVLGYDLSDDDNGKVYRSLMRVCERKSSVGAKELEAIIASSAMQAPSTYHLESYTFSSSNLTSALAHVTLTRGDEVLDGVATGDGPIDASFRAIEQCVGYHYELDDFQIQSVTEGKESLGDVLVKLRNNGRLYSGNGLSTDIVGASIRAYVNALNKIAFDEN